MRALNVRPDIGFVKISATLRAEGTETGSKSCVAVASRMNTSLTSRCRFWETIGRTKLRNVFAAELSIKIGIVTFRVYDEGEIIAQMVRINRHRLSVGSTRYVPIIISDSQGDGETSVNAVASAQVFGRPNT